MNKKAIVILANGSYPSHQIPLEILQSSNYIVCCDGAVNQLVSNNLEPYAIIGDFDSTRNQIQNKYKDRCYKILNQNRNDLQKALDWCNKNKLDNITILGSTGKRNDHDIGNVFTLLQYPLALKCNIITDYGQFTLLQNKQTFQSFEGQQVSIFAADQTINITSKNLKYELLSKNLKTLYGGTLNESTNSTFDIAISHGKILVFQNFKV